MDPYFGYIGLSVILGALSGFGASSYKHSEQNRRLIFLEENQGEVRERLSSIEAKLDLLLNHNGWRSFKNDPSSSSDGGRH